MLIVVGPVHILVLNGLHLSPSTVGRCRTTALKQKPSPAQPDRYRRWPVGLAAGALARRRRRVPYGIVCGLRYYPALVGLTSSSGPTNLGILRVSSHLGAAVREPSLT